MTLHQFTPAMKPGIVIYLVQSIGWSGLNDFLCCGWSNGHRSHISQFLLSLGQEIIAIIRVGIARMRKGVVPVQGPCHRAMRIEEYAVGTTVQGHFTEVVAPQVGVTLREQMTAIAIQANLAGIMEAHLPQLIMRKHVHPIVRHTNLHPAARREHGVSSITLPPIGRPPLGSLCRLLYLQ